VECEAFGNIIALKPKRYRNARAAIQRAISIVFYGNLFLAVWTLLRKSIKIRIIVSMWYVIVSMWYGTGGEVMQDPCEPAKGFCSTTPVATWCRPGF
jgi:hypothetical protein